MADHPKLPDEFDLQAADRWDRVEAADGTVWVVLKSRLTDTKTLVREDVVEHGYFDHPLLTGVLGMLAMVAAFLSPPLAGAAIASDEWHIAVIAAVALAGIAGGWVLVQLVYYRTPVGLQVERFLEWAEHRQLLVGRDPA